MTTSSTHSVVKSRYNSIADKLEWRFTPAEQQEVREIFKAGTRDEFLELAYLLEKGKKLGWFNAKVEGKYRTWMTEVIKKRLPADLLEASMEKLRCADESEKSCDYLFVKMLEGAAEKYLKDMTVDEKYKLIKERLDKEVFTVRDASEVADAIKAVKTPEEFIRLADLLYTNGLLERMNNSFGWETRDSINKIVREKLAKPIEWKKGKKPINLLEMAEGDLDYGKGGEKFAGDLFIAGLVRAAECYKFLHPTDPKEIFYVEVVRDEILDALPRARTTLLGQTTGISFRDQERIIKAVEDTPKEKIPWLFKYFADNGYTEKILDTMWGMYAGRLKRSLRKFWLKDADGNKVEFFDRVERKFASKPHQNVARDPGANRLFADVIREIALFALYADEKNLYAKPELGKFPRQDAGLTGNEYDVIGLRTGILERLGNSRTLLNIDFFDVSEEDQRWIYDQIQSLRKKDVIHLFSQLGDNRNYVEKLLGSFEGTQARKLKEFLKNFKVKGDDGKEISFYDRALKKFGRECNPDWSKNGDPGCNPLFKDIILEMGLYHDQKAGERCFDRLRGGGYPRRDAALTCLDHQVHESLKTEKCSPCHNSSTGGKLVPLKGETWHEKMLDAHARCDGCHTEDMRAQASGAPLFNPPSKPFTGMVDGLVRSSVVGYFARNTERGKGCPTCHESELETACSKGCHFSENAWMYPCAHILGADAISEGLCFGESSKAFLDAEKTAYPELTEEAEGAKEE